MRSTRCRRQFFFVAMKIFAHSPHRRTMTTAYPADREPNRALEACLHADGSVVERSCNVYFRRAMPAFRSDRGRGAARSIAGVSIRQLVECGCLVGADRSSVDELYRVHQ